MKLRRLCTKGLWALLSLLLLGIIVVSALYIYLESQLPDVETLKTVQLQVPLRIYSADKLLIAEFGEKRRIPVKYKDIPKPLIYALLSTEDQRFFDHPGVDIIGLGRAVVQLIKTGRKGQGGSTITMQVARNFFLSRKKTFLRKFNEILLAIKIDSELSKEKILELYLNKIYLGSRAYGVAAAAKVYYGKTLEQLSLAQMAMIAGLPQAPSSNNPLANPITAKKRRNHVLDRMFEEGIIDQSSLTQAQNEPITARYHQRTKEVSAPYVAEMVRASLFKHFGPDAYIKGYRVYTTINSRLQSAANTALEDSLMSYDSRHGYRGPSAQVALGDDTALAQQLERFPTINDLTPAVVLAIQSDRNTATLQLKNSQHDILTFNGMKWARPILKSGYLGKRPTHIRDTLSPGDVIYVRRQKQGLTLTQIPQAEAAIVSLSPKDGAIVALAGGFNFYQSKFNRATQASRQPGSSFKPFIYAAALAKGFTLATTINDAPVVVDDPSQENLWRPHNDTRRFYGPTRLRVGLTRSRNLVSIRLLESIGIQYAVNYIEKFGFKKEQLPHSLSLALGSLTLSPIELAAGYAVFANGGFHVQPYLIASIANAYNKPILHAKPLIACPTGCGDSLPQAEKAPSVISPQVAYLMTAALKDVVQHGTAKRAKILRRTDLAGKTGTTNDKFDAWFAGFNGRYVTTTWVGFDKPRSLKEYASKLALPMWIDYMRVALKDTPPQSLSEPANLVTIRIDPRTGLRAKNGQKNGIFELFREDKAPPPLERSNSALDTDSDDALDSSNRATDHLF